jgi:hypothetical protein
MTLPPLIRMEWRDSKLIGCKCNLLIGEKKKKRKKKAFLSVSESEILLCSLLFFIHACLCKFSYLIEYFHCHFLW